MVKPTKINKKASNSALRVETADEPIPPTAKVNIEIIDAKEANNRLYLKTVINSKELMNFDYPCHLGANRDVLLSKIKSDYITLKNNLAKRKIVVKKDLLGSKEV